MRSGGLTAKDMSAVLGAVGIHPDVVRGIESVDRGLFVTAERSDVRLLNASLQLHDTPTWLSAPGVVALMLDQLRDHVGERVLEIGVGTGYHAAVLLAMYPDVIFTGVDPNPVALEISQRNLHRLGYRSRVTLVEGSADDLRKSPWDTIYSTAALDEASLLMARGLSSLDEMFLQSPRALTKDEFESESSTSWLRDRFESHDAYLRDGWREFLAITVYCASGRKFYPIGESVYDFTFVAYEPG